MTYKQAINFTGHADPIQLLPPSRFDQAWLLSQFHSCCSLGYYNLLTTGTYRYLGWEYHFELPRFIVYHQGMWGVVYAPDAQTLMEIWEEDLSFIAPLPPNLLDLES